MSLTDSEPDNRPSLLRQSFVTLDTLATRLLDSVMPPRCLRCGAMVADPGALCSTCFEAVTFITDPFCHRCGIPFADIPVNTDTILERGSCLEHPPAYDHARAVFVYDADSRPLVTRLKYADRTDHAPSLARWMHRAGSTILEQADFILPVPLHRWRLISRTFNQSTLLVRHLSKVNGIPAKFHVLRRIKATPHQGGLSAKDRQRNVANAFRVVKPDEIAGKKIVLIDDALTTGATLNACARVLKSNEASRVDALVAGRVPAPGR